jgi:AraC-like DNA-binding protein
MTGASVMPPPPATRRSFTAIAALARTAIEAARAAGVDVDAVLGREGITMDIVEEEDGRIDSDVLVQIWERMAATSGDPFFGLHAGERFVSAKTVHVVGYAARHSRTLADCYARTVRFAPLTNEASEIEMWTEGSRAVVRVGPKPGLPTWPRCYAEMAVSAYLTIGRKWTGVAFAPLGATFQHAAPADVSEYVRLFGESIRFGAPKNELYLASSTLELPLRENDPDIGKYLDARAKVLLDSLEGGRSFENDVRAKIDEELVNGSPALSGVAKRLGMSRRTLQRRLAEQDLSFAGLVDDVRRKTALGLMASPQFAVSEVAALTGYLDAPSFRAAFVRWTGRTPREYRKLSAIPEKPS